jgi:hypothetical protein
MRKLEALMGETGVGVIGRVRGSIASGLRGHILAPEPTTFSLLPPELAEITIDPEGTRPSFRSAELTLNW